MSIITDVITITVYPVDRLIFEGSETCALRQFVCLEVSENLTFKPVLVLLQGWDVYDKELLGFVAFDHHIPKCKINSFS